MKDPGQWQSQEDPTGSEAWGNFKLPRKKAGSGPGQEMGTGQGTS